MGSPGHLSRTGRTCPDLAFSTPSSIGINEKLTVVDRLVGLQVLSSFSCSSLELRHLLRQQWEDVGFLTISHGLELNKFATHFLPSQRLIMTIVIPIARLTIL